MIFGIGLPGMFAMLQVSSEPHYAAVVPCVMIIIAMIRPPVMSYEVRIITYMKFKMTGGYKKSTPKKSTILAAPKKSRKVMPSVVKPANDALHVVTAGKPIEMILKLHRGDGAPYGNRKVRVLIDGAQARTTVSSANGEVVIILEPNECTGERTISVHAVRPDGTLEEDSMIARRLVFEGG